MPDHHALSHPLSAECFSSFKKKKRPPDGVILCDHAFWALNLQNTELMGLLLFCLWLQIVVAGGAVS